MHILIIDDEPDFCVIFKKFLESRDFSVSVSHELIEGLKMIENENPDIVFIDNFLPDGEGWNISKQLKAKHPGIHINLMSARDKSFTSLQQFEDYIWEKPITTQQLDNYFRFMKIST